jgi:DUF1009 family protein
MNNKNIAILAGKGKISLYAIEKILKQNYKKVVLIGFKNHFQLPKKYKKIKFYSVHPGYVKKILKILKREKISKILFVGKIDKNKVFKEKKFDLTALKLLIQLKDKSDFSIMQKLVEFFQSHNIKVISQKKFFAEEIMPEGNLTISKITKEELDEIKFGYRIAKKVASAGIGQSIIIENRMIKSVEAIEGTDMCIKRTKKYVDKNAIFIKTSKARHNPKFDLPGFGLYTLKLLLKSNIKTIALQAGWVLLIEKNKIIDFANKHRMKIFGIK